MSDQAEDQTKNVTTEEADEAQEAQEVETGSTAFRRKMEFYRFLGPLPVLSSENDVNYFGLLLAFDNLLNPQDAMESLLVREVVDATWEETRLKHHKVLLPERRFRDTTAMLAARQKMAATWREADAKEKEVAQAKSKASGEPPKPDAESKDAAGKEAAQVKSEAQAAPTSEAVGEGNPAVLRKATEFDHAAGLEAGFDYYQKLDQQLMRATKQREHALAQFEHWRDNRGMQARALSDRFIAAAQEDAVQEIATTQAPAVKEIGAAQVDAAAREPAQAAPPVVPTDVEGK